MKLISIQVAATRINGAGAQVVSLNDPDRTNFSLYLRYEDGTAEWVKDYNVNNFNFAMVDAATLSMTHQVPIEPMEGLGREVRRDN